jgi:hypothetical protein
VGRLDLSQLRFAARRQGGDGALCSATHGDDGGVRHTKEQEAFFCSRLELGDASERGWCLQKDKGGSVDEPEPVAKQLALDDAAAN